MEKQSVDYRGNNRRLVSEQFSFFEKNKGSYWERDMRVFRMVNDSIVDEEGRLIDASAKELKNKLNLEDDSFTVILLGKDGGVKLRQSRLLPSTQLYALIDAMPMRKQEMRERKNK